MRTTSAVASVSSGTEGACNGEHTVQFLEKLAAWLGDDVPTTIIWDGAPWHRNKTVQQGH